MAKRSKKRLRKLQNRAAQTFRFLMLSKLSLVALLILAVIPLSAFEAHVVNVTAKIERRSSCNALSIGYWRNHEGCTQDGGGSSIWESQVQALSATFSGVFATASGADMCFNLWIPNCPSGNSIPAKLCKAKAQTLADELNVVSARLDLNALIAGADDGSAAFDNLGLTSNSTVSQALAAIEAILANNAATSQQLTDAAHVAERIYTFYEDENPQRPECIFEPPVVEESSVPYYEGIYLLNGEPEPQPELTQNETSGDPTEEPAVASYEYTDATTSTEAGLSENEQGSNTQGSTVQCTTEGSGTPDQCTVPPSDEPQPDATQIEDSNETPPPPSDQAINTEEPAQENQLQDTTTVQEQNPPIEESPQPPQEQAPPTDTQ